MVTFGRVELLSHPVCLEYINMKWKAYGFWFFAFNMGIYLLFVASITGILCTLHPDEFQREARLQHGPNMTNTESYNTEVQMPIMAQLALVFMFIFLVINFMKEFMQIYQQRWQYFTDYVNYMEWTLYLSSLLFILPILFMGRVSGRQYQCGAIAIFLAWLNLLMYLQRTNSIGIYVVMFLQILSTVLRVTLVFSVLIVGFGLTFHILLNSNVNLGYGSPLLSIMHSMMMMMGDWNFVQTFVSPMTGASDPLPYPTLSFAFLIIFVIFMQILFVNLLIGLAVGDIENVKKNARLRRLAMQVEYHTGLEEKLPRWILERVDSDETCKYVGSLIGAGGVLPDNVAKTGERCKETAHLRMEMDKSKKRMKAMQKTLDQQHELLRLIVQKMQIVSEVDQFDEGTARNSPTLLPLEKRQKDHSDSRPMTSRTSETSLFGYLDSEALEDISNPEPGFRAKNGPTPPLRTFANVVNLARAKILKQRIG